MMFDRIDPTFSDAIRLPADQRPGAFPLGTPAGAGPLIGWVRGPEPAVDQSTEGSATAQSFVLTRQDRALFDGQDSGFLSVETANRIWLWTEAALVVGREGSGVGGAAPDPSGQVALALGLDPDNHLAVACYKRVKHPDVSESGERANLMVQLVHVSPAASVRDLREPQQARRDSLPEVSANHHSSPSFGTEKLNDPNSPLVADVAPSAEPSPFPAPMSPSVTPTDGPKPPPARGPIGTLMNWAGSGLRRIVGLAPFTRRPAPVAGAHKSIRRHLRFAVAAILLLAGGVGGWAATTELSGAVIAMGQLVVDSNVKKVQHPFGGVITELAVRDGDRVNAGDIVVRLDGTETRANLTIVSKALDELYALQSRDEAMRDGATSVTFPPELMGRVDDPAVADLIEGERRLFDTLISAANGQKAQLKEQVAQLDEQTRGMLKQLEAKAKEIDWSTQELVGIRNLWKQKLVGFPRVTTAERDAARLEGEHGALLSAIAETKGKIAEMELRILQIDEEMRSEVGKELSEARGKMAELVEKKVAAEDRLQRLDIRAPQSGVVHELEFHTVGGVIQPGATIMGVVPDSDALTAEIRVAPPEIDQLRVGQKAILRFLSFNQQTTPELNAELTRVSADVTTDQKTGANYYTARVKVAEQDISKLTGLKLMAGMPVEVFVQTSPRTVISYLMRPIMDQVGRAFRER